MKVFLIIQGQVNLFYNDTIIATMHSGQAFGGFEILSKEPTRLISAITGEGKQTRTLIIPPYS